jgi:N6-adenosine-specific RNA methylase IME4
VAGLLFVEVAMQDIVLHQDESCSTILIDIPLSLQQGQLSTKRLKSALPPDAPYQCTEPQGRKRQILLSSIPQDQLDYEKDIRDLLATSLVAVHASYRGDKWCRPRIALTEDGSWEAFMTAADLAPQSSQAPLPPVILAPLVNNFRKPADLLNTVVCNPNAASVILSVAAHNFRIPSHTVFLCSSINQGSAGFSQSAKLLLPSTASAIRPHQFDLILMDPPWSNRSVRRGRFYSTADGRDGPFERTVPVIRDHLSEIGIVAVWITNKAAVRLHVLTTLADLGLRLQEEWVWMKVTTKGEPVTALDGIWRKPYEILLLLQQRNSRPTVPRRVIIAVPDIHSRKPCLKNLIESYLPRPYRALEIFARNLTAGWWSWGDEVLKFQHERYWADTK